MCPRATQSHFLAGSSAGCGSCSHTEALLLPPTADAPVSQPVSRSEAVASALCAWIPTLDWGQAEGRVQGKVPETADATTFRFQSTCRHWFAYKPGQFTTLDLKINGKKVRRSYTISSSPSRPMAIDITVEFPEVWFQIGCMTTWKSAWAMILGPGEFTCADQALNKILLVSAGSGITPCMSMTRFLYDSAASCDIVFLHSARSPEDILFRKECEQYDAARADFVTCDP